MVRTEDVCKWTKNTAHPKKNLAKKINIETYNIYLNFLMPNINFGITRHLRYVTLPPVFAPVYHNVNTLAGALYLNLRVTQNMLRTHERK